MFAGEIVVFQMVVVVAQCLLCVCCGTNVHMLIETVVVTASFVITSLIIYIARPFLPRSYRRYVVRGPSPLSISLSHSHIHILLLLLLLLHRWR